MANSTSIGICFVDLLIQIMSLVRKNEFSFLLDHLEILFSLTLWLGFSIMSIPYLTLGMIVMKFNFSVRRKDLPPEQRVSVESLLNMSGAQSVQVVDDTENDTSVSEESNPDRIIMSSPAVGRMEAVDLPASSHASPESSTTSRLTSPWTVSITKTAEEVLGIVVGSDDDSSAGGTNTIFFQLQGRKPRMHINLQSAQDLQVTHHWFAVFMNEY